MSGQFISLSLFMILLSFFIVLVAHSNYDETKIRKITSGLRITFSDHRGDDLYEVGEAKKVSDIYSGLSNVKDVQGVFSAEISGIEAIESRGGDTLAMRIPTVRFLRALDNGDMWAALSSFLQANELKPYHMEIFVNVDDWKSGYKVVDTIRGKLLALGMRDGHFTIGMAREKDSTVDVVILPYREARSVVMGSAQ